MIPFGEVIEDASRGNGKVPQSSYLMEGEFPVVDQGQKLIAGFSNDMEMLCKVPAPVIVFGDHTRALKYIDFPFVVGADGVKVLRVRDGWEPKYVFHYLRSHPIPSAGYSRHYKFLKHLEVPRRSLHEQQRIAVILDKADSLRARRREALVQLETLLQSIFFQNFGDPIDNPRALPSRTLGEWVHASAPITYGILKPGDHLADGVPYVRVVDLQDGGIASNSVRRTSPDIDAAYARSRLSEGDLVISIRGHVGRIGLVPAELTGANITQDSARIRAVPAAREYLATALTTPAVSRWMKQRTKGAAVQGINLSDLRLTPIPVPPENEMAEFTDQARLVRALSATARRQLRESDSLFYSLQSKLFAGTS